MGERYRVAGLISQNVSLGDVWGMQAHVFHQGLAEQEQRDVELYAVWDSFGKWETRWRLERRIFLLELYKVFR